MFEPDWFRMHSIDQHRRRSIKKRKPTKRLTSSEVLHKAIKKHAGLSDFDDAAIWAEVEAIEKELAKHRYKIVEGRQNESLRGR